MLSGYDRYHLTTDRHDLTGAYIYHCEGGDERKLFMLRDSFADAMDDFLAAQFHESYMVHYSSYSHELADREQPDIFVYETVERRIGELLTFRIESLEIDGVKMNIKNRGDVIRTRDFYVPNVALYQAEPHPDLATVS